MATNSRILGTGFAVAAVASFLALKPHETAGRTVAGNLANTSVQVEAPSVPIKAFHRVSPKDSSKAAILYRGARPSKRGIGALAALGVRTVIDLQGGDGTVYIRNPLISRVFDVMAKIYEPGERQGELREEMNAVLSHPGMKYENFPLNSLQAITPKEAEDINRALRIMHDPERQPIYVHCEHGHDRTGLLIALYRVRYENVDAQAAHQEMVEMGHDPTGLTKHMDEYFWKAVRSKQPVR